MRTWCYQKVDFIKAFKQELKKFYKNLLVQKKFLTAKKNFFSINKTLNKKNCFYIKKWT